MKFVKSRDLREISNHLRACGSDYLNTGDLGCLKVGDVPLAIRQSHLYRTLLSVRPWFSALDTLLVGPFKVKQ